MRVQRKNENDHLRLVANREKKQAFQRSAVDRNRGSVVLGFRLLQFALAILLAGAGADKIFQASLTWNQYVPAILPWLFGMDVSSFLAVIGLFEVALALGLVLAPGYFGGVVSLWLLLANFNLVASGNFLDLGLRDLSLAICAFALGSLGQIPEISTLHRIKPRRFRLLVSKNPRFQAAQ
ncbi:MAG: hypothetical protein AB7K68_15975 [Bacteriovoracia bacterium]